MSQIDLAKSKKYFLLIVIPIIFIIIGILIVGIILQKKNSLPKKISQQELILELPYLTQDYSIVYSNNKNQIYINVFKPPYEENRLKALKWIKDQGVDPTKLNISYTPRSKFKQ